MNERNGTKIDEDIDLARTTYVLGVAALVAVAVPPGLIAAPLLGAAALGSGLLAWARVGAGGRDRLVLGMVFGTIAVLASSTLLFVFRHLIVRVLHDINVG
jgi:hypothetical protein